MKINRLTQIDLEKEYDKVEKDYETLSSLIEQLYKEGSMVDPKTHAFLRRRKDPRFAPELEGMRKRTVPLLLRKGYETFITLEGDKNFDPRMEHFERRELADGGALSRMAQIEREQQKEIDRVLKLAEEDPGLQEVSLFAPKAPLGILSQALNTSASKLASMVPQQVTEAFAGLPSLMARGSGKGFERFGKRRGATYSRVNQNLDELISDFFAQSKGGTDLSNVSQYTIELLKANLPAIRAAAARQKQNPKAGLNRVIKIIEELD